MEIQTEKERNPPFERIQRDSPETQVDTETFENYIGLKTTRESGIQTGTAEKAVVHNAVETVEKPKSSAVSTPKKRKGLQKPDSDQLKRKKYIIAKADSEGSAAIEMVQTAESAAETAVQTGGVIRTAVKGTSEGVGKIRTMVKSSVGIGTRKDIGKVATAVGSGLKKGAVNLAKDTGNQLLRTQIDKSKITDTGTEAIKQGLTYARYADNARKAVQNTARGAIKTAYAVRNLPKNTAKKAKSIQKNAKRTAEAAKKTASVVVKAVTSKVGIIIILAALLILLIIMLLNGLVTMVVSAIGSLFSWMFPDGDTSDTTITNNISTYISQIQSRETAVQSEIDSIVNSLSPEYRYDGTQIMGLNVFGNRDLQPYDYNAVLAVLATQKFQSVIDGNTEDFHFTEDEINNALEMFYNFNYYYKYDYCPDWNCSIDEDCLLSLSAGSFTVTGTEYRPESDLYAVTMEGPTYTHCESLYTELEVYMIDGGTIGGSGYASLDNGTWTMTYTFTPDLYEQIDWENFYLTVDTVYCNNPNHCYLYGSVVNYSEETVMRKANFNEDQREIYEVYCEQIQVMGG